MNYLNPYNFYFEMPLYTSIEITLDNLKDFHNLISFEGKIDGYNPKLREQTTFQVKINRDIFLTDGLYTPDMFDSTTRAFLKCLRTEQVFEYYFIAYKKDSKGTYFFHKIGQWPSIADIHISQIKDYNKVLSNGKLKELTKAIGLAANGVGIGSFVYLRRIFEYLIEEAHLKVKETRDWDETEYQKSKMNGKIEILKDQLPEFLHEHKEIYGILSKGIHELEEDECLQYFLPVKTGIELILDDKMIESEKALKRAKASNAIKSIQGQLNNNGNT